MNNFFLEVISRSQGVSGSSGQTADQVVGYWSWEEKKKRLTQSMLWRIWKGQMDRRPSGWLLALGKE
jgi:hypothetical protein